MKKAYARVKEQEEAAQNILPTRQPSDQINADPVPASLELHPDRLAMLAAPEPESSQHRPRNEHRQSRPRRPKQSRYKKELELGEQRKANLEAKRKAREARANDRKAMAKAKRPGKDGKAKLGRQGTVLLSRIRRMAEEGKI